MIAWGYFFPPPEPQRPAELPPATAESAVGPVPVSPPPQQAAAPESAPPVSLKEVPETPPEGVSGELEIIEGVAEERVVITSDTFRAEFTSRGAQLVSFRLLEHESSDGGPVDLVRARATDPHLFGFATLEGESSPLNEVLFRVERASADFGEESIRFLYQGAEGRVEKRFTLRPDGLLDVEIDAATGLAWAMVLGPGVRNPST
jgi:YidC/Oxa1 family membrane protein insertase